jgi:orotidine-5'-phosphate decarboxylase
MNFADRLLDAIAEKGSPICVGIDPMYDMLPDAIAGEKGKRDANNTPIVIDHYHAFIMEVLQIVAPIVPVVKFQSAYFEQYHSEGVDAYYSLINEAKQLGLLTIGDAKRGDIGSTTQAYAAGHLEDFVGDDADEYSTPDALTINPMLGMDAIEPFVSTAIGLEKGLFVLVRTSNPGSKDFQDVALSDGRSWSELVADTLNARIESAGNYGKHGFCSIGAVVGATQTHTMVSMRKRLPRSIFLLPGYGTQGATGEMTQAAFDDKGRGAIVSASRSILYPKPTGGDWKQDIENAVLAMRSDLAKFIGQ